MNESASAHAIARRAREARIHALRMRVAAIAVALFLAAWVGLFLQLVSGHDPALASSGSTVTTQSADPSVADDGSGAVLADDDASSQPADAELSSSSSTQSSAPAAVTTGQS